MVPHQDVTNSYTIRVCLNQWVKCNKVYNKNTVYIATVHFILQGLYSTCLSKLDEVELFWMTFH